MKTYLILVPVAALLIVAAFFILQADNPLNLNTNKETGIRTEFTGKISGLPIEINDASLVAIFQIVDPTTALLTAGKEIEREFSSYRIETTPGWRMVILKVWDFGSKKVYTGASRAFNFSEGESSEADIIVNETGIFDGTSKVNSRPGALISFNIFPGTAYAAENKPVFVVVSEKGPYSYDKDIIEILLANNGNRVQMIDGVALGNIEEERNLPGLAPDAYGDFMPSEPNFVVKMDVQFKVNRPVVTISLINVENQEVFWEETTDERAETAFGPVMPAAERLVESLNGKGPNPVKLPKFTPSIPKPVKSPAEWGKKIRKALGFEDESGTGMIGPRFTDEIQSPPAPTCDFNGFVNCRDKFNLQGCIDACPYVPITCPPGTPPNTDCKQTDQGCSDACWEKGNTHGASCAKDNNCTPKEIDTRLRQM